MKRSINLPGMHLNMEQLLPKIKGYMVLARITKDAFSGNVKGMGPGVAEIEMEERPSEVFCIFFASHISGFKQFPKTNLQ